MTPQRALWQRSKKIHPATWFLICEAAGAGRPGRPAQQSFSIHNLGKQCPVSMKLGTDLLGLARQFSLGDFFVFFLICRRNPTCRAEPVEIRTCRVEPAEIHTCTAEPVEIRTCRIEPLEICTRRVECLEIHTCRAGPLEIHICRAYPVEILTCRAKPQKSLPAGLS